jgi:hypothetical protein
MIPCKLHIIYAKSREKSGKASNVVTSRALMGIIARPIDEALIIAPQVIMEHVMHIRPRKRRGSFPLQYHPV